MTSLDLPPRRGWRTVLGAVAAGMAALLVVQAIRWRVDPPMWLPNGIYPRDLFVEGAFKAHESRRWALTGNWVSDPADEYRFWKVQAPMHAWPLALWLKVVGVTWGSLRAYSVATFAAGWLTLLGAAVRWRRDGVAVMVTVAMLGDFYLRHAARSALLEVPLMAWAAWMTVALVSTARDPRWAASLPWLAAGAFLTKQSGAYLGATALVLGPWLVFRHRDHPALPQAVGWTALGTVLVGLGLGWVVTGDDYWRTVQWNVDHVLGDDSSQAAPVSWASLDPSPVLDRLTDAERWTEAVAWYLPVALPLALVQLGATAWEAWHRRRVPPDDAVVGVGWLMSVVLVHVAQQIRLRFSLVLFPPTWWLAGRGAMRLWRRGGWVRWGAVGLVTVGLLASHGAWHRRHAASSSTWLSDGNAALADTLTPRHRLVGAAAPWMAFSTRADHFVVRWPFHCSREAVQSLGITHLLRDSQTGREYTRHCLRLARRSWNHDNREVTRVVWRGRPMILEAWSVHGPTDRRR